jgi:ubiquitin carboxyl-terminal hydrolase 10
MHIFQSQSTHDGPSDLRDARQQMLISALPPILVLHLNRVRYDAAADGLIKIGKSIQFGPDLEIPLGTIFSFLAIANAEYFVILVISDIMVPNAQPQPLSEPPHYKLYGVLYHHGESAGNGHYTIDILRPNGDGDTGEDWLHIDDEAVTRVRHEAVFGEDGTDRAAEERCAYLLFYCRTSPIGTS